MAPAATFPIVLIGTDPILAREQDTVVVLVPLVVAQLSRQDVLLVALRQHFSNEVEALDIDLPDRDCAIDDCYVRLGIVFLITLEPDVDPVVGLPLRPRGLKAAVQEQLQVRGDALVQDRRATLPCRNTIDQLPLLLLGPRVPEGVELLHRELRCPPQKIAGHLLRLVRFEPNSTTNLINNPYAPRARWLGSRAQFPVNA